MERISHSASQLQVTDTHSLEENGIFPDLGYLPPGTLVTEDGLACLLGRECRETIKRAVDRGELPRPVKLMGRNTWTVGTIIRYMEDRLAEEAGRFRKMRS